MTSLAVLPNLKRTITDIMEDELYHVPNSPMHLQGGNGQASATGSAHNGSFDANNFGNSHSLTRAESPKIASRNNSTTTSVGFVPLAYSQSFSNTQASIPDSFIDQYKNLPMNGSFPASVDPNQIELNNTNTIASDQHNQVSPFADYANPDSQFTTGGPNNIMINNFNNTNNASSRRRRLTTLEMHLTEKPINDEDYYLFNTDIQPSHLVPQDENVNEDFLCLNSPMFVPPSAPQDIRVPEYENDYLMMSAVEDFEEDMEEETSDDDDNYFHDDFEEMLNDNDTYWNNNEAIAPANVMMRYNNSVENLDSNMPVTHSSQPFSSQSSNDELLMEDSPADDERDERDERVERDEHDELIQNTPYDSSHMLNSSPNSLNDESKKEKKSQDFEHEYTQLQYESSEAKMSEFHKTAAEISATNPNHQCDLINPSTSQPCNKQFSRPYDLIRHQETIHASKKKIFRCVICEGRYNGGTGNGKSKTFSRGDALSRHIKVKHGLFGKEALDLINDAKANVEFVSV